MHNFRCTIACMTLKIIEKSTHILKLTAAATILRKVRHNAEHFFFSSSASVCCWPFVFMFTFHHAFFFFHATLFLILATSFLLLSFIIVIIICVSFFKHWSAYERTKSCRNTLPNEGDFSTFYRIYIKRFYFCFHRCCRCRHRQSIVVVAFAHLCVAFVVVVNFDSVLIKLNIWVNVVDNWRFASYNEFRSSLTHNFFGITRKTVVLTQRVFIVMFWFVLFLETKSIWLGFYFFHKLSDNILYM